ncbi:MAG TPA: sulfotransferase [Caldilineaceae bacterium]|nr:sulfotransferase [Caldilineaceae bacterium]
MTLVTIIGRGHSGTRAISHTLYASGVYMGACLNRSGDLIPPEQMYEACRVMARYVEWKGGLSWDFSRLHTMPIPDEFTQLIHGYLKSVLDEHAKTPNALVGWKIPETTLVYPWIRRMFPDIKYIFWIRDPRDCVLNRHITDDLRTFGIHYPPTEDVRLRRAISWKYQYDLVKATPKPANWIEVRFEDFVLRQEETLARLEEYLGIPLARIIVRPDAVERYKHDDGVHDFDFFAPALAEYGYI